MFEQPGNSTTYPKHPKDLYSSTDRRLWAVDGESVQSFLCDIENHLN
jgi:hypothetical protein